MSYDQLLKIILVGNSYVGKSSMLQQVNKKQFKTTHEITIAIEFSFKFLEINNKLIKLSLWDTGGEERFRGIAKSYYRSAQGALIIYDITDRTTFENARNYWIQECRTYGHQDMVIVLVGNKVDLEHNQEAQQLANDNGFLFFETSAADYQTIIEVFTQTAEKILKVFNNIQQNNQQSEVKVLSDIKLNNTQNNNLSSNNCC